MRDRTVGETFYMFFTTRAFATGIPTVLAGTPVISAYEDNSVTQITAGITLGVDHDSVVGLNLLTLVATGANGYEAGKDYSMVITTGTVGGVSVVGEVVGEFSLGLSSAFTRLGAPAGASIAADLVVIDDFVDGIETAVITNAAGADISADILVIDNFVDGIETAVITNAAGADIAADIIAVKAETASILTDTGTTLDTKINDIQGATFSSATDSLEAVRDRGDAAWITGSGTGLTPLASGTAQGGTSSTIQLAAGETFADSELNGNNVKITTGTGVGQSRVITAYTGATDTATVSPNWTTTPSSDSVYEVVDGSVNITVVSNVAEDVATGTSQTTAQNDLDIITGTAGALVDDGTGAGQIALTAGAIDNVTLVATTTTNTDMVGTDSAALASVCTEGRLAELDAANLPTDVDAILVDTGTTLDAALAVVDTNVDQIEAAVITNATGVDIAADIIALKAETVLIVADTNELQTDDIPGSLTTLQSDTDDIQTRLPSALVGGRMDSDVEAINNNTTAADNLGASALGIQLGACEGTPTVTVIQTDLAEATDDHFIGRVVVFTSGAAAQQATDITDYTGSTGTITVTALTTAPAAADTFVIV